MRLFIAIELPKDVVAELARLQKEIDLFGLRQVKEFHLTLKFLGDVPDSKIERVKEALRTVKFKPFRAELSETGVFPNPSYVRVVWAGVKADEILQLQKQIELGRGGINHGKVQASTTTRTSISSPRRATSLPGSWRPECSAYRLNRICQPSCSSSAR